MSRNTEKDKNEIGRSFQRKPIKMRPCTINDMREKDLKSYFETVELFYYYCFEDDEEIYIEGDFDGDTYTRIDVYFTQCRNST